MKAIASLICAAAFTLTNVAAGAEPARPAKMLVVLRAREATDHLRQASNGHLGQPVFADQPPLAESYRSSILDFDRDSTLAAALTLAFRDRAPFVELATSADRDRYMTGALLDKPTKAARTEGFDFVLAVYDSFVGFAPRNGFDDDSGVLSPEYGFSYALHDLATDNVIQRGAVHNYGYKPVSFDDTTQDRELFKQTWPYLCLMNTTDMVDDLVRKDAVREMAERVGRSTEYPGVRADIEAYRKRLVWSLQPAAGWVARRTRDPFERVMFPRGDLGRSVWMHVDAELLLPALGQQANTAEEFIHIYDRDRARLMPDFPITAFTDITAPGYGAWRYTEPNGEQQLVFMRKTSAVTIQVMTVTFAGKFNELYPPLRSKIEEMLAHSVVKLN